MNDIITLDLVYIFISLSPKSIFGMISIWHLFSVYRNALQPKRVGRNEMYYVVIF